MHEVLRVPTAQLDTNRVQAPTCQADQAGNDAQHHERGQDCDKGIMISIFQIDRLNVGTRWNSVLADAIRLNSRLRQFLRNCIRCGERSVLESQSLLN